MSLVYGNSYLTIAAVATPNPSHSLFPDPLHQEELNSVLAALCAIVATQLEFPDIHEHNGEIPKWSKRGPASQEYLLSARVLHFTDRELIWHCNELVTCECLSESQYFKPQREREGISISRQSFQQALAPSSLPRDRIMAWHTCAEEYSKRTLSRYTDRAPAISGVAEASASIMGDKYYAGSWGSSIIEDMCWWRVRCPQKTINSWTTSESAYLAPSWSWFAPGHPVGFVEVPYKYSKHITLASAMSSIKPPDNGDMWSRGTLKSRPGA
jgi:hypothetical protein